MPGLPSDVAHSSGSRQSARRRVVRRYLTGLSAAGVTVALALTGAVSDASASPAANPPARVITLTSNSTASTGHLTIQVKHQLEPRGRNKLLSVTFSGRSKIRLSHPVLIVSLRPVLQRPFGRSGRIHVTAFSVILRIHSSRHFSSRLPARLLALISKALANPIRRRHQTAFVLAATAASVSRPGRPTGITTIAGMQVGVLLGPVMP